MLVYLWTKVTQKAQRAQDNLDGRKWSKYLFSQHDPQNSAGNFFSETLYSDVYYIYNVLYTYIVCRLSAESSSKHDLLDIVLSQGDRPAVPRQHTQSEQ